MQIVSRKQFALNFKAYFLKKKKKEDYLKNVIDCNFLPSLATRPIYKYVCHFFFFYFFFFIYILLFDSVFS